MIIPENLDEELAKAIGFFWNTRRNQSDRKDHMFPDEDLSMRRFLLSLLRAVA